MQTPQPRLGAPEWLILVGASLFIAVLALSAFWEADIRWLHFFQAWMYVATIALSLRGNRWGYFIGISAALIGGKRWQKLHRLIYFSAIAGVIHFWWLVKRDVTRPEMMAVILTVLLGFRIVDRFLTTTVTRSPAVVQQS